MNSNSLEQRPLADVVKKLGSSKTFFTAIVLGFISLALTATVTFSLIPIILQTFKAYFSDEFYFYEDTLPLLLLLSAIFLISIITLVFYLIMQVGLLKSYRYFSGKTDKFDGFPLYLKFFKIIYIFYSVVVGVPIGLILLEELYSTPDAMIFFFVLPITLAFIAGAVIYVVATYRAVKKTMQHAMSAANNEYRGDVSVFLIVTMILQLVVMVLSTFKEFTTGYLLYDLIYNSCKGFIITIDLTNTIISFVETLLFLILLFKFKSQMEPAIIEWFNIKKQKEHLENKRARTEVLASSNESRPEESSEPPLQSTVSEENGDSV